jgi:Ras-related protein Rab-5C
MRPPDAKVVLLGPAAVGKTSIASRALGQEFDPEQPPTVGSEHASKAFATQRGTILLRIWDTAGQERYRSLAPMYYQDSQAAVVVFSLVDAPTFADARRWVSDLQQHFEHPPKLFVVGNKMDLPGRTVPLEAAVDFASSLGAEYMETSARTGENIPELFNSVAEYCIAAAVREAPEMPRLEAGTKQEGCGC